MSSWSDRPRAGVLRGSASTTARPAGLEQAVLTRPLVQAQVAALVRDAVDEGRRAGYEDGYGAGEEAARLLAAQVEAELRDRRDQVLARLAAAAGGLEARQAVALAEVEDAVVSAAFELATALLDRELELAASPGRDALARALRLAPERGPVVARLHPGDLAALVAADDDASALAPGRQLSLVGDASIEAGGCVVEVAECRIDARLGPALARVREALG